MLYREVGQFKTDYNADQAIFPIKQDLIVMICMVAVAYLVIPFIASDYWFEVILLPILVFSLAALGLNILTGYCGQISLGTGGFMAVGAYSAFKMSTAFPDMNVIIIFLHQRALRRGGRDRLRPAEPAHQGLLPGRGDAGLPVLLRVAVPEGGLVLQLRELPEPSAPRTGSSWG